MNLVETAQELIVVSELEGRKVKLHLVDFDLVEGTLHSISGNGVLIKTEDGDYEFYPWHQVNLIQTPQNQKTKD